MKNKKKSEERGIQRNVTEKQIATGFYDTRCSDKEGKLRPLFVKDILTHVALASSRTIVTMVHDTLAMA